jgi:hypothetical protein
MRLCPWLPNLTVGSRPRLNSNAATRRLATALIRQFFPPLADFLHDFGQRRVFHLLHRQSVRLEGAVPTEMIGHGVALRAGAVGNAGA